MPVGTRYVTPNQALEPTRVGKPPRVGSASTLNGSFRALSSRQRATATAAELSVELDRQQ